MTSTSAVSRLIDDVRGEVARRRTPQRVIAELLGISQTQVSARLRGDVPWRVDELDIVARHLGMQITIGHDTSRVA